MTRQRTLLMASQAFRGGGMHARWTRHRPFHHWRRQLPGASALSRGGLGERVVIVARGGTHVPARLEREATRLAARGARPPMAAVGLACRMVAVRLGAAQLFAARGARVLLPPARHRDLRGTACTAHLHTHPARIAAAGVANGGTLMVLAGEGTGAHLVALWAAPVTALAPAGVALAGALLGAARVAQILFEARHRLRVAAAPTHLLYHLPAGVAGSTVTALCAGVDTA